MTATFRFPAVRPTLLAVLLTVLAACGGGGDDQQDGTPEADGGERPEARTVQVSALAVLAAPNACVAQDPDTGFLVFDDTAVDPEAEGHVLPVTITVTPTEKDAPSVSFTETA